MKIKTGDTVIVIAGKDKGKKGKVLKTLPKENKVVVEGINVLTHHRKPKGPTNPGGLTKAEGAIDASNVMYFDSKANASTRIGIRFDDSGNKIRFSKKSGEKIGK